MHFQEAIEFVAQLVKLILRIFQLKSQVVIRPVSPRVIG